MLVYSGQHVPLDEAIHFGLFATSGGLLQIVLSIFFWPMRQHEPELRLLAALYADLSQINSSDVLSSAAPPLSNRATKTRNIFSRLGHARTIQHERSVSLLAHAERVRLSILMLWRVWNRWRRNPPAAQCVGTLNECLGAASVILADIGKRLSGHRTHASAASFIVLHECADRLKLIPTVAGLGEKTFAEAARRQIEALASQLRSALELAASSTQAGRLAFMRTEEMRPWRLRIEGVFATLRANATLQSSAFRHAVRLSGAVLAAEVVAYSIGGPRSYWLPMTVVLVLRPDFITTFNRGVLRLTGTLAGLLLATALFQFADPRPAAVIGVVFLTAFILRCFGPANYGILATAVSALIVLLFSLRGQPPEEVIQPRAWNTLWGGLLAFVAYAAWPTWERSHVSGTIADLLDAYRAYFSTVCEAYIHTSEGLEHDLDRTRNAARVARSNAQASIDRFRNEPGASKKAVPLAEGILASSHRFVHAVMALEAGLAHGNLVAEQPTLARIADHVEIMLHSLAGGLRGSRLTRELLPDIREVQVPHNRFGDATGEEYVTVKTEIDRIADSLATLSNQVLQFSLETGGRSRSREMSVARMRDAGLKS
jgi:uncharacterized membrane protein YccC